MKHIFTLYLRFVFILLGALMICNASAQTVTNPNITPVVIMAPNPSPYLSDWQSNRQCITLNASLDAPYNQSVKLMAQVSLNGLVVARTKPEKMPMLSLHQGMNSFVAADIIPLQAVSFSGGIDQVSQRAGRLPEGQYEICVWFANAETGFPLVSAPCQPFTIRDVNPPVLISPANNTQFSQQVIQPELVVLSLQSCQPITIDYLAKLGRDQVANLKCFDLVSDNTHNKYYIDPKITDKDSAEAMQIPIQFNNADQNQGNNFTSRLMEQEGIFYRFIKMNPSGAGNNSTPNPVTLNFSWLPPMPAPSIPVQYRLLIVPILSGQTPQQALQTATPVFQQDGLFLTSFSGTESMSRLFSLAGKTAYAWSVQAHDALGKPIGQNNGWSEIRTFAVAGDPDFDLLRINGTTTGNNFFDIFFPLDLNNNIDVKPEPCGKHAELVDTKFGPWHLQKSYSQYYNVWTRNVYNVYRIIDCGLEKGHSGPHHGSSSKVYVLDHVEKSDQHGIDPPPPTPPASMGDEPPKKDQMSKDDIQKILDNDKAGAGNGGGQVGGNGNNGGGQNGSNGNGSSGTGNGTGTGNANGTGTGPNTGGDNDHKEPCPYTYKVSKGHIYVPNGDGTCKMYAVFQVFTCSLWKGHSGPHHGTLDLVYVLLGSVPCRDHNPDPEPPKGAVKTWDDINKIPSKEKADKADAPGAGSTGGPGVKIAGQPEEQGPCPYIEKTLLRTVAGSWRLKTGADGTVKGSKETHGVSLYPTGGSWAGTDATWERDIWNVFSVKHCTLLKGHGGAHKLDKGSEEFEKKITITAEAHYEVGEDQVPPKDSSDSLPHEDPPKK